MISWNNHDGINDGGHGSEGQRPRYSDGIMDLRRYIHLFYLNLAQVDRSKSRHLFVVHCARSTNQLNFISQFRCEGRRKKHGEIYSHFTFDDTDDVLDVVFHKSSMNFHR